MMLDPQWRLRSATRRPEKDCVTRCLALRFSDRLGPVRMASHRLPNKSGRANRRCAPPLNAGRQFGRALHAPAAHSRLGPRMLALGRRRQYRRAGSRTPTATSGSLSRAHLGRTSCASRHRDLFDRSRRDRISPGMGRIGGMIRKAGTSGSRAKRSPRGRSPGL
jgi:hypothetical protein